MEKQLILAAVMAIPLTFSGTTPMWWVLVYACIFGGVVAGAEVVALNALMSSAPDEEGGNSAAFEGSAEEIRQRLLTALQAGNYIDAAVAHAGIDRVTFYRWMARGRPYVEATILAITEGEDEPEIPEEDLPYFELVRDVQTAQNSAEARLLLDIQGVTGGPTQWQAKAWILERTRPEKFGRTSRVQLAGDPDAPIRTESQVQVAGVVALVDDDARTAEVMSALIEAGLLDDAAGTVIVDQPEETAAAV